MINPHYLQNLSQIKKVATPLLFDFLEQKSYVGLKSKILNLPFRRQKEPLKYSYSTAKLELPDVVTFLHKLGLSTIATVYKFGPRDYTLLHDDFLQKTAAILDLTSEWDENWGGQIIFDGKKIQPRGNSLIIINDRYYIKYLNHHAKTRYLVILQ